MTRPEYDDECNCGLCTSQRAPQSLSVRSQRSFQEHMQTLHQNIDNLVYAAHVACGEHSNNEYHCPLGKNCPFKRTTDFIGPSSCIIDNIRLMIGDPTPQSDIEIPDNNIQAKRKEMRK